MEVGAYLTSCESLQHKIVLGENLHTKHLIRDVALKNTSVLKPLVTHTHAHARTRAADQGRVDSVQMGQLEFQQPIAFS
ncbi:hypothetical protein J6590_058170 [Homalodisca vitripennis]|nr:hypothetical protein J6590_058170 [Homalodisca vitripennis]